MRTIRCFVIVSCVGAAACGSGSPSSPTSPPTPTVYSCPTPGSNGCPPLKGSRGVGLAVTALEGNGTAAPFSYTFSGITISGVGTNQTAFSGLAPGDYEVSGDVNSQALTFFVNRAGSDQPGGFAPNSVQSVEGPVSATNCQTVAYAIAVGGARPQHFRFKFTIAASGSANCF